MKFRILLLVMPLMAALNGSASAHGHWRDRSPDDRQQMREQMREHWQQGEERSAYPSDRNGGMRWRDMPPEERRRLREEMRGRAVPELPPERRPPGG